MSAFNWFTTMDKAFDLRTKTVTDGDYTVRVGAVSDNFVVDRVVKVTTTADDDDSTITVPDGQFSGQKLLVILTDVGDDETVTVTPSTGDSAALGDDGDYVSYEWIDSTTGWQTIHSQTD